MKSAIRCKGNTIYVFLMLQSQLIIEIDVKHCLQPPQPQFENVSTQIQKQYDLLRSQQQLLIFSRHSQQQPQLRFLIVWVQIQWQQLQLKFLIFWVRFQWRFLLKLWTSWVRLQWLLLRQLDLQLIWISWVHFLLRWWRQRCMRWLFTCSRDSMDNKGSRDSSRTWCWYNKIYQLLIYYWEIYLILL